MTFKRDVSFETNRYLEANIKVHTAMADVYNSDPHFRPENKAKVRKNLESCVQRLPPSTNRRMLDIGCGTGFILDLSHDLFDEVHGIDITPAMLSQVNTQNGKVRLQVATAEKLPFQDQSFQFATAYSFLDHLVDLEPVFREVFRVLQPGGLFFSDQTANYYFWRALKEIEKLDLTSAHHIVQREIRASLHNELEHAEKFGFSDMDFKDAEFIKSHQGGVMEENVVALAKSIGFSKVEVRYEWYLGQAKVMHQQSLAESETVEAYLREALPLTRGLFKYLQIVLVK